jgi:hypothetical protein
LQAEQTFSLARISFSLSFSLSAYFFKLLSLSLLSALFHAALRGSFSFSS